MCVCVCVFFTFVGSYTSVKKTMKKNYICVDPLEGMRRCDIPYNLSRLTIHENKDLL